MQELIEQRQIILTKQGDSKYALIPVKWLEILETKEETTFTIRLCKGKKGTFIDLFKTETTQ